MKAVHAAPASPARASATARSGISPTSERTRSGHPSFRRVQHVVEEAVLVVPQVVAMPAMQPAAAHGVGDVEEVLPELARDVLVGRVRRAPARSRWPAC